MNQSKVILSIGSNKGNKLENIKKCVEFIYREIATVIRISNIYQTQSWGFDSQAFYNCALVVYTYKTPEKLLQEILILERKFGRTRTNSTTYQDREIDIDIIAFDQKIIQTENLEIPHPKMQERLFVLKPLEDLQTDFVHPIFKKNIADLLCDCTDKGEIKIVGQIENPLQQHDLKRFETIIIEGNIGVGKTTLATKISEDFNAKLILEGFADNPFLPKFYKNPERYALALEMAFLTDRYRQLSDDLRQLDLFKNFTISDYFIIKCLIFAKVTLSEDEYRLYKKIFDIMYEKVSKPSLYIYLNQNTEHLLENIRKRKRTYEQEISIDYLKQINKSYIDYIKQQKDLNVLIIDVSDKNFIENQSDYIDILEIITNHNYTKIY